MNEKLKIIIYSYVISIYKYNLILINQIFELFISK